MKFATTYLPRSGWSNGAAALALRLLRHALAEAIAAGTGPVVLCRTPDAEHPALPRLADELGIESQPQGDGDLGTRMQRVFEHAAGPTLLMGADAPALDAARLRQAAAALATHDAVFVPALDGGYALVGLNRAVPQLFERMRWSTPEVMARTRERLVAAGLRHAELDPVADIDLPADLAHLPAGWLA